MSYAVSTTDFLSALQLIIYIVECVFNLLDSYYFGDYSLLDFSLGFMIVYITLSFFYRIGGVSRTGLNAAVRERKNSKDVDEYSEDIIE